MKKPQIVMIIVLLTMIVSSCLDKKEEVSTSPYAKVTGLSFATNDSFPGLSKAVFTIDESDDSIGIIFNEDSLLYGTELDSVVATFTFKALPGLAVFISDHDTVHDTVMVSLADTLNFTPRPTRLYVQSSDATSERWYHIYVNVHQVDPELFVWTRMTQNVYDPSIVADQKLVLLNKNLYLYTNNGFANVLYVSTNQGASWQTKSVSGLPDDCHVRNILEANGLLYYPSGNKMYLSEDGETWTVQNYTDMELVNMLYELNDSVWAIAKQNDAYYLASAKGKSSFTIAHQLPENFPISDYATLSFASASGRPRAMVVGGFSADGRILNTRWNVEYDRGEKRYHYADFSISQPSFAPLTGVSLVQYDDKIYMFGSANADAVIGEYPIMQSVDEGMNWSIPDTTTNKLPDTYIPRQKVTAVVDEENHLIYLVGGQSRTEAFADVYRGRLNKMTFDKR